MMYFTEGRDAVEDPSQMNAEFEPRYNSDKYEAKLCQVSTSFQSPCEDMASGQSISPLIDGDGN
jgi:hypothetical protein